MTEGQSFTALTHTHTHDVIEDIIIITWAEEPLWIGAVRDEHNKLNSRCTVSLCKLLRVHLLSKNETDEAPVVQISSEIRVSGIITNLAGLDETWQVPEKSQSVKVVSASEVKTQTANSSAIIQIMTKLLSFSNLYVNSLSSFRVLSPWWKARYQTWFLINQLINVWSILLF